MNEIPVNPPQKEPELNVSTNPAAIHHPSRIHALWVLFLIWFFPPYGWHNMWVHKKYHHWFPILSIINCFLLTIPSLTYIMYTYPSLSALSKIPPVPVN